MKLKPLIWMCFGIVVLAAACKNDKDADDRDSARKGSINISVDETFEPIIQQQIQMYEASFPGTKINATYKSEADCFRDLQKDSTRLVIVARGLNEQEQAFYKKQLQFAPKFDLLAYDAIAVIQNKQTTDSLFTIERLKKILSGNENTIAVVDGKNATATVRYLKDSILRGGNFGKNVVAANGSDSVLNIIAETPGAIGFIGLSWIGDRYDKQQIERFKKIQYALIECVRCTEKGYFAKPSQASISYAQYPLARGLYCIVKENNVGLGTGFFNFMSLERGQLIFRRAFMVPNKMNFKKRKVLQ
jgi:phosphate transport system substrate-binding protein